MGKRRRRILIGVLGILLAATICTKPIRRWRHYLLLRDMPAVYKQLGKQHTLAQECDEEYRRMFLENAPRRDVFGVWPIGVAAELDWALYSCRVAWGYYHVAIHTQVERFIVHLERYSDDWRIRSEFASYLIHLGLRHQAATKFREVLDDADSHVAMNNLATLYNHTGRDKEAMQLYRAAIAIEPTTTYYWNLAVAYSVHRQIAAELYGWDMPRVFAECINAYKKAIELDPQNKELVRDWATQYVLAPFFSVSAGDVADDAIGAWKAYLELEPGKNQQCFALTRIGMIYLRIKRDALKATVYIVDAYNMDKNPLTIGCMRELQRALDKLTDEHGKIFRTNPGHGE